MWIFILTSLLVVSHVEYSHGLATSTVNTNILTMFSYENHYVYVYSALANQNDNLRFPERWMFYYVPIAMIPFRRSSEGSQPSTEWLTTQENRIRVKILLGNEAITKLAREAIVQKFPTNMSTISKSWDVSPLMIDALTVSVVESGTGEALPEVNHFEIPHPNGLVVTATFTCLNKEIAQKMLQNILNDVNDIEVAFQFAGFRQVSTSFISITSNKVKEVYKKTVVDGGGTQLTKYIHRGQVDKFAQDYLKNVRVVVYSEKDPESPSNSLVNVLLQRFMSVSRKGVLSPETIRVNEKRKLNQIWSNKDLQPDQITREMNEIFQYNEVETKKRNHVDKYFNVDRSKSSSNSFSAALSAIIKDKSYKFSFGFDNQKSRGDGQTAHVVANLTTIMKSLSQSGISAEWNGNKFIPRQYGVYRLTELANILEESLFAKIQTSLKKTGAIIRKLLWLQKADDFHKSFEPVNVDVYRLGKVWLYAGIGIPPLPWLLCDGRAVSRTQFQELFKMIGDKYGSGDGKKTFNLPDLRSRLPLGTDPAKVNSDLATHLGRVGGKYVHVMNSNELPRHSHEKGSLSLSPGATHTHDIIDGGHNHGGRTAGMSGSHSVSESGLCLFDKANRVGEHYHSISKDHSNITILDSGDHSHKVTGNSGSVGSNKPINVVGPYQVIQYIIYSGQYS
jgi:microcystin-dependent protein